MGFYGGLMGFNMIYPAWWTYKKLLKMAIEIVDFPIKNGDFPWQNVSSPEGMSKMGPNMAKKKLPWQTHMP